MAYWRVKVQGFDGETKTFRVEADDPDQACRVAGFHPSAVAAVDKDVFGNIIKDFTHPKPSLNVQQMMLANLSAMVEAGTSGEQAIRMLLAKVSYIKYDPKAIENCQTVHEFLRVLRFDKMVILLAKAGQDSGDLAGSLYRAAQFLEDQIKIKEEAGKGIVGGLIKIAIGLAAVIVLPLVMGPQIENFLGMKGVTMRSNPFTEIMLAIMRFEKALWWAPLVAMAVIFFLRKPIWQTVKTYPIFKLWVQLAGIRRGISFISTYSVMLQAKVPTDKAIAMLASESSGEEQVIYSAMQQRMKEGTFLADTMDPELWPESVRSGLGNFDRIGEDLRYKVLNSLGNNLRLEQKAVMRSFERLTGTLGMVMLIVAILVAVLGFYMPIVTMTPDFGG